MNAPLKTYWAWDYTVQELGSWPTGAYTGHPVPHEIYLAADVDAALVEAQWVHAALTQQLAQRDAEIEKLKLALDYNIE